MIDNPLLTDTIRALSVGGVEYFQSLLPRLVIILFSIGILYFFFMLVTGGIDWISSGGDKNKLEVARDKLSNALIGFIILLSVFAIAKLLENLFGLNILNLDIAPLLAP